MDNPYPEWGNMNEPEWAFRAVAMITRLQRQLAELQEAVRWEMECKHVLRTVRRKASGGRACSLQTWCFWAAENEITSSISAARAAVDKLIGGYFGE